MYSFILYFLFFVDMFKEDFSIIPRPNEISFSDEEFSFDEARVEFKEDEFSDDEIRLLRIDFISNVAN